MFRFTIRDVLWLTVLVALVLSWWLDRRFQRGEFASQLKAAEAQRQKVALELETLKMHNKRARAYEEAVRQRMQQLERRHWNAAKAKSQELGAPQPTGTARTETGPGGAAP
jgi:hypothetical protein